jgi:hypothetical protein
VGLKVVIPGRSSDADPGGGVYERGARGGILTPVGVFEPAVCIDTVRAHRANRDGDIRLVESSGKDYRAGALQERFDNAATDVPVMRQPGAAKS